MPRALVEHPGAYGLLLQEVMGMGSYPRCAPRSGRCEGREGVVCVRVCLAGASVGLIGGCGRRSPEHGARSTEQAADNTFLLTEPIASLTSTIQFVS